MGGSPILPAPTVATTALVLLIVLLASPATVAKGSGLSVGFYKKLCPKAEKVVRRTVTKAFEKEPGTPADIIRLFFHDCFVRVSLARSCSVLKFDIHVKFWMYTCTVLNV
jgi:hypothetical protein